MISSVIERSKVVPNILKDSVLYQYKHPLYRYEMIRRTFLWGCLWTHLLDNEEEAIRSFNSYTVRLGDTAVYADFLNGGEIAKEDSYIARHVDILEILIRYVLWGNGELELLLDRDVLQAASDIAKADSIKILDRTFSLPSSSSTMDN